MASPRRSAGARVHGVPKTEAGSRPARRGTGPDPPPRPWVPAKGRWASHRSLSRRLFGQGLEIELALEIAVYATLPAGPALAAAIALGSAAVAWAVAAGLAALVAVGFTLLPMAEPRLRLGGAATIAAVAGGVLLGTPPMLVILGVTPTLPVVAAIAMTGAGALIAVGARHRAVPGTFVPWCATLPALLASAGAAALGAPVAALTIAVTLGAAAGPLSLTAVLLARVRVSRRTLLRSLERGRRDFAAHDAERSLEEFDRAIAAAGAAAEGGPAWSGRGAALAAIGRFEDAIASLDAALAVNPNDEVAWLNRGNALTGLGRLADALQSYNAAIRANPRYEVAWNNKGNTLARLGQFEEALACYNRALTIDAGYTAAWVNKGLALTRLGRFEEAAQCAERALRLTSAPFDDRTTVII